MSTEESQQAPTELQLGTHTDEEITLVADEEKVEFWGVKRPNGWLSNFAVAPFTVDGVKFETNEHFFQASKFKHSEKDYLEIAGLATPKEAFKAGRDRSRPLREDWEEAKIEVMKVGIQAKYTQNEAFKSALISTGSRKLIEHSPHDKFWGDGGEERSGENKLGQMLEVLRKELQEEKPAEEKKEEETPAAAAPAEEKKAEEKPAEEETKKDEEEKPATTEEKKEEEKPATEEKKDEEAAPATTEEKKEDEKPAEKTDADADAEQKMIEDLRRQIEDRKKEIAAKKEEKESKDKENDELQADADNVRKNLKEKQDQLNTLNKEKAELEKEKNEIQPAYERALENHELRERADALKKDIETEEETLNKNQQEVQRLEVQLEEVSAAYKRERESKERLQKAANEQLAALRTAVDEKIGLVLPIDDEESEQYLNPDDTIEAAEAIFRDRGHELSNNTKLSRELEAIVAMKKEAVEELEKSTQEQLDGAEQDRDESIREMIFQMQDERNNLHADIEEIKKINREQAVNLRRGHVEKHADPMKFKRQSQLASHLTPKNDPHTRHSSFKKEEKVVSDEMKLMVAKNKELETELVEAKSKITSSVAERTEVLKTTKTLEARIRRDTRTFETELARIEAEILSCEHKVSVMERENSRMTEAVEHLGGLIKSTKDHMEHVRGKTEPLPLE